MSPAEVPRHTYELLQELTELSDKHGYTWHADYIRETLSAFEQSMEAGWEHLISIQFWGGPGSIADVSFSPDDIHWHKQNGRRVSEYLENLGAEGLRTDRQRYAELLCALAEAIKEDGPTTDANARWRQRAIWIGDADRTFLTNGSI